MLPSDPQINAEGVLFSVRVEQRFHDRQPSSTRECFISNEVLALLADRRNLKSGPRDTFVTLQTLIVGVARRLAQAGVRGTPIRLASGSFQG